MHIRIRHGFEDAQRDALAAIYWSAFSRKLTALLGDWGRARPVLMAAFDPAFCLTALDETDTPVGMCGIEHDRGTFVHYTLSLMQRHYGLLSGGMRSLASRFLHSDHIPSQLYVCALAVRPEARGQGVGAQLLAAAADFARARGDTALRLDVVDTNPDAQRLYERLGFSSIRTRRYPFLRSLGFTGVHTMLKPLTGKE
jgi:ribosomal protein S18 acetylase RimI-like enzyme